MHKTPSNDQLDAFLAKQGSRELALLPASSRVSQNDGKLLPHLIRARSIYTAFTIHSKILSTCPRVPMSRAAARVKSPRRFDLSHGTRFSLNRSRQNLPTRPLLALVMVVTPASKKITRTRKLSLTRPVNRLLPRLQLYLNSAALPKTFRTKLCCSKLLLVLPSLPNKRVKRCTSSLNLTYSPEKTESSVSKMIVSKGSWLATQTGRRCKEKLRARMRTYAGRFKSRPTQ